MHWTLGDVYSCKNDEMLDLEILCDSEYSVKTFCIVPMGQKQIHLFMYPWL